MKLRMMILAGVMLGSGTALHAQADSAAAAPARPRINWTADQKKYGVGDIVSILVDEYTIATADRSTSASQDRSKRMGMEGGFSTGTGGTAVNAGVRSTSAGESRQRGRDSRQDRLAAEVTGRIVAIEPNGVLKIEGRKKLVIDEHEQEMIIVGLARSADIMPGNVIDSWRMADAQITYETNGKLGKPKAGILTRLIDKIWP